MSSLKQSLGWSGLGLVGVCLSGGRGAEVGGAPGKVNSVQLPLRPLRRAGPLLVTGDSDWSAVNRSESSSVRAVPTPTPAISNPALLSTVTVLHMRCWQLHAERKSANAFDCVIG